MPKKNHRSNASLGKTLINNAHNQKMARITPSQEGFVVHTTDMITQAAKPKLNTILEMDSLDEFVQMAEMSQKRFEGLRGTDAIIVNTNEVI
jgi:hypothetical protein